MKKNNYLMLVTLLILLIAKPIPAESLNNTNSFLTVEETLGAVFLGEPAWNVFCVANKDAKPDLYRILNRKEAEKYHPNIISMLSFIGDETDIHRFKQMLKENYSKELTTQETMCVQAIFNALGVMSRRGIPGAAESLDKMIDPKFWISGPQWQSAARKGLINHQYETVAWVFMGYAISGKTDLKDKVAVVVGTITNTAAKDYMEHRISPSRISVFATAFDEAQKNLISPEVRSALKSMFNKDFENPGRATLTANDYNGEPAPAQRRSKEIGVKGDVSLSLKQEAISAYTSIVDNLINDRYEELAKSIADNGKPLLPLAKQTETAITARAAKLKAMTRDLESTKNIIRDLQATSPSYGDAAGETLSDGTIIVKIPCIGSNETKARHLPQQHEARTVDSEERLVIYMIKQDGRWYWNPFGW